MTWQIARACSGGDCILVQRDGDGRIWLRPSTDPEAEFHVTRDEFAAFLNGAKNGEFDHLVATP
jgi:hypothetical protein